MPNEIRCNSPQTGVGDGGWLLEWLRDLCEEGATIRPSCLGEGDGEGEGDSRKEYGAEDGTSAVV